MLKMLVVGRASPTTRPDLHCPLCQRFGADGSGPGSLGFLALDLAFAVAIINLLAYPDLDGGHLLYYLIELIKAVR